MKLATLNKGRKLHSKSIKKSLFANSWALIKFGLFMWRNGPSKWVNRGLRKLVIQRRTQMTFPKGLPHFAKGEVIKGFGRGSKELGIPTANYDVDVVNNLPQELSPGIYFGFANVDQGPVYKMVMSVGWNPFYKNTKKSMETYVIHKFEEDFYGKMLKVVMLGYLRPEKNFPSVDELIQAINGDVAQAEVKLEEEEFVQFKTNDFFSLN